MSDNVGLQRIVIHNDELWNGQLVIEFQDGLAIMVGLNGSGKSLAGKLIELFLKSIRDGFSIASSRELYNLMSKTNSDSISLTWLSRFITQDWIYASMFPVMWDVRGFDFDDIRVNSFISTDFKFKPKKIDDISKLESPLFSDFAEVSILNELIVRDSLLAADYEDYLEEFEQGVPSLDFTAELTNSVSDVSIHDVNFDATYWNEMFRECVLKMQDHFDQFGIVNAFEWGDYGGLSGDFDIKTNKKIDFMSWDELSYWWDDEKTIRSYFFEYFGTDLSLRVAINSLEFLETNPFTISTLWQPQETTLEMMNRIYSDELFPLAISSSINSTHKHNLEVRKFSRRALTTYGAEKRANVVETYEYHRDQAKSSLATTIREVKDFDIRIFFPFIWKSKELRDEGKLSAAAGREAAFLSSIGMPLEYIELYNFKEGEKYFTPPLSSGYRNVFSLMSTVCNAPPESIIFLDEPEISLHISLQNKLLEALIGIRSDVYILVATHSPELILNNIDAVHSLPPLDD